ncbi:MAG TPA: hypothetical protein VIG86_02720 [Candidatus Dormibacteraeota bacterium]|jgi:hypothetical protein
MHLPRPAQNEAAPLEHVEPEPPSAHVALGIAQCHGIGCSARTGILCAYVDRRGRVCPTAWCPGHRTVFENTVFCTLHGATMSGMHSDFGDTQHPDLDNRLPALIAWISRTAEDDIVAALQDICRDRGEVLVADPVRRVLLGRNREPTWERAWKTCSAVGVSARVAIAVEESEPGEVLAKVNSQVIARLSAPRDNNGQEPRPEVVELLVRQLVLLIVLALDCWQQGKRIQPEQRVDEQTLIGERAPLPLAGMASPARIQAGYPGGDRGA